MNTQTGEYKKNIKDVDQGLTNGRAFLQVQDQGGIYTPRCSLPVTKRTEYYSSLDQAFGCMVRFRFRFPSHSPASSDENLYFHIGYRAKHNDLWNTWILKSCNHHQKHLASATLGLDTLTMIGQSLNTNNDPGERIWINLVKGDARARWIALFIAQSKDAKQISSRGVILRGDGCCEDCALDAAASLPGKWMLIL